VRPPRRGDPPTRVPDACRPTGGAHFQLGRYDDVNATFTQIAMELHHQYLLGFTPQRRDGKVHEITVQTKDRQQQVRARRYYLAPAGGH
jgi:hypothetical protein